MGRVCWGWGGAFRWMEIERKASLRITSAFWHRDTRLLSTKLIPENLSIKLQKRKQVRERQTETEMTKTETEEGREGKERPP